MIGQHLLLAPASKVVEPAQSVLAHRPNPIPKSETRGFPQNRKSMSYSVCGRVWSIIPEQVVLLCKIRWAHNLQAGEDRPDGRKTLSVDLRSGLSHQKKSAKVMLKVVLRDGLE